MAYKYQAGQANLSGALEQQGDLVAKGSVTVKDSLTPESADGAALGSATLEWSDLYLADGGIIYLGDGQDVTLTHIEDTGVRLNAAMQLQFRDETEYINSDANGYMNIRGATGVDLNIAGTDVLNITAGSAAVVGSLSSTQGATLASAAGTVAIGSATAASFTAAGILNINNTTNATSTTDGSLQTDGGLSVALDAVIGDDIMLLSDAAEIKWGTDSEIRLYHAHDDGLVLESSTSEAGNLTMRNSNADANCATLLMEKSSSSPADNDQLGNVSFFGYNDNQQQVPYAAIDVISVDVSDGSEDAGMNITVMVGGSEVAMIDINRTAVATTTMQEIVNLADHDGSSKGLKLGGTLVTSTAAEINYLDGALGTAAASKALVFNGSSTVTCNGMTFSDIGTVSAGIINVAAVDIDGATDIGEALVDADLIVVDNGAGGTNRKCALSRLKTYIGGGSVAINSGSANFTASVGVNFFNSISAAIECKLPAKSGLSAGESIIFKAGSDCSSTNTILVSAADGDSLKIDGANDVTLESPYAAIEVVYVSSSEGTEEFRIL